MVLDVREAIVRKTVITWSVLLDPVLTKIYMRQWKRYLSRLGKSLLPGDQLPTLYGYIFGIMYKEL